MSALYTALLEGESKESLARMVCEHRETIAHAHARLADLLFTVPVDDWSLPELLDYLSTLFADMDETEALLQEQGAYKP